MTELTEAEIDSLRAANTYLAEHPGSVDVQLVAVEAIVAARVAAAWEDAASLADSVIVSWMGVPGLHPEAKEPHPAAIAAGGARRTLVVLRSRVSEAFEDRRADRDA